MSIYDKVWTYTNGYEWMTCLQIVATHAFLKTAELEAFRCPFSSICETRTAPTKICQVRRHTKHDYFAFPNWRLQKRLVKNDSTIFKNLQTTRQVWKSCRFCRFCRFFGLLDLAFLPFSASWTTAGSVAITSNHKFFSAGSTVYCLLLWSVMIFLCNARFCRWPSKVLPLRSLGQDVRALGCLGNTGMKRTKMKWHERLCDETSMRSWPGDVMWCDVYVQDG